MMENTQYPVPSQLYAAVQAQESQNDPNAVSPAGAVGLMQTMPETLRDPGYGVAPAKDDSPEELQRVGRDYLQAMHNKYKGNTDLALMAYNWGPTHVDKVLSGDLPEDAIPKETATYPSNVYKRIPPPEAVMAANGKEVTDPDLLAQLNGSDSTPVGKEVTDPDILSQLNGAKSNGYLADTGDAISKGGARLISNVIAPVLSEKNQQKLRDAGLYDVKHPEIANPFERGVAESPLGVYSGAIGSLSAPIVPVGETVVNAAKKAGVTQETLDHFGMAGNILSVPNIPNPTAKTPIIQNITKGIVNKLAPVIDPRTAQIVKDASDLGINIPTRVFNPGAVSGGLNKAGLMGGDTMQSDVTTALSKAMGHEGTPNLDVDTMSGIQKTIGGKMDNFALKADGQGGIPISAKGLAGIAENSLADAPKVKRLLQKVQDRLDESGNLSGSDYQALTKKGGVLDRAMNSADSELADTAKDLRGHLDDQLSKTVKPDDLAAFNEARRQYRTMKVVQPLVESGGVTGTPDSASKLFNAVSRNYGSIQNALKYNPTLGKIAQVVNEFPEAVKSTGSKAGLLGKVAGLGAADVAGTAAAASYLGAPAAVGVATSLPIAAGAAKVLGSKTLKNAIIKKSLPPTIAAAPKVVKPTLALPAPEAYAVNSRGVVSTGNPLAGGVIERNTGAMAPPLTPGPLPKPTLALPAPKPFSVNSRGAVSTGMPRSGIIERNAKAVEPPLSNWQKQTLLPPATAATAVKAIPNNALVPHMEGVVSELENSQSGHRFFDFSPEGQGGTPNVMGVKSDSPAWFQNYNKNNPPITKKYVRDTFEKMKSGAPLGEKQQKIADTIRREGLERLQENEARRAAAVDAAKFNPDDPNHEAAIMHDDVPFAKGGLVKSNVAKKQPKKMSKGGSVTSDKPAKNHTAKFLALASRNPLPLEAVA